MKILRYFFILIFCIFLTILTQVGGIFYLLSLSTHRFINRNSTGYKRLALKMLSFSALYLIGVFLVVPFLAKPLGRVPLPLVEERGIQPGTIITVFLCRNYVRPELREVTYRVSEKMQKQFPGTVINYLDANFPFIDKFPLLPHLSHNDGKKLDLSFAYRDTKTKTITNELPSLIGYGVCEEPKPHEDNTAKVCAQKGHWQYSFLKKIIHQGSKHEFLFDEERTKELVKLFSAEGSIGKIFIEPHLKSRLGLASPKVRFHGCQAVRHDDHIHVQLF